MEIRKGKFTSSNLDCLLVNGKNEYKLGTGAIELCHEKLAERLSDWTQSFDSPYTDWGTQHESESRELFEQVTGKKVTEVGFIPAPDMEDISGGSPDGVIFKSESKFTGDLAMFSADDVEAIIEIKCPATSKVHLHTLLSKEVDNKKYMLQMQWNMYCTGAKKAYFVSYDPRMTDDKHKLCIIEVERDEDMINTIKDKILVAENYINKELIPKLGAKE
jgi:predicted phage-related endonuclease